MSILALSGQETDDDQSVELGSSK